MTVPRPWYRPAALVHTRAMTRAGTAATWGCIAGALGLLLGALGGAAAGGFDATIVSLSASAIAGGVGWCLGVLVAWSRARDRRQGSAVTSAWLLALGALVFLVGRSAVTSVSQAAFGPAIDDVLPGDPSLRPLLVLVVADTAIVVASCVALASAVLREPRAR
jgi:hypothetical protein